MDEGEGCWGEGEVCGVLVEDWGGWEVVDIGAEAFGGCDELGYCGRDEAGEEVQTTEKPHV